ncbi:MAG: hypothetical protein R3C11_25040 [Planctomycetaceae bacterium]
MLKFIEIDFQLLQPRLAFLFLVHNPASETDGTLNFQSAILNSFSQICQRAPFSHILIELANPGFDSVVTQFGS